MTFALTHTCECKFYLASLSLILLLDVVRTLLLFNFKWDALLLRGSIKLQILLEHGLVAVEIICIKCFNFSRKRLLAEVNHW